MATLYFNTTDLQARRYNTACWIANEANKIVKKAKYSGRVNPCCLADLEYVVAALEALECYTPVTTLESTATSTSTTSLIDTTATFVTSGVDTTSTVTNDTTGKTYTIIAVVSETELTIDLINKETFTSGDEYTIGVSVNCLTEAEAENLFNNISKITGLCFVPKNHVYATEPSDDVYQTATLNSGQSITLSTGETLTFSYFSKESPKS